MTLSEDQSFVRHAIGTSLIATLASYSTILFLPSSRGNSSRIPLLGGGVISEKEMLFFSSGFWMAASILRAAKHRFVSPDDIAGQGMASANGPSPRMKVLSAVLQNTLEQSVLLVLVGSLLLNDDSSSSSSSTNTNSTNKPSNNASLGSVVRINSILFFIGRYLFTTGYDKGIGIGRGLGFGLSFLPQVLSLGLWAGTKVVGR